MKLLPQIRWMPRVNRDIDRCIRFVARFPSGQPADRERDIFRGMEAIRRNPAIGAVQLRRRSTGLELRRHNVAQFVIVYLYVEPNSIHRNGLLSIRAIRHASERNVFWGVREPPTEPEYLRKICQARGGLTR